MSPKVPRVRKDRSQWPVFIAAFGLGLFGLAQVITVGWALRHQPKETRPPAETRTPTRSAAPVQIRPTPSPFSPILPERSPLASADSENQSLGDFSQQAPAPPEDISTEDDSQQDPQKNPIPLPLQSRDAAKHLAMAAVFETDQDLLRALQNLQQAERIESGHPEVLYRLGTIYQKFGNQREANAYFRRVAAMGKDVAGQFATFSEAYLKGEDPEAPKGGPLDRSMSIQKITQQYHGPPGNPERLSLLVPIRYHGEEPIDPSQCLTLVFFYDLVDGTKIEQSFVTDIDNRWRTEPVDWASHPEELLEIIYHLPSYDSPEDASPPSREHFGYILKLFYRDEIQDVVIEPRMLIEKLAPEDEPITPSENPLFPN